jgi:hypothetical protein
MLCDVKFIAKMTRATIATGALVTALVLIVALVVLGRAPEQVFQAAATVTPATTAAASAEVDPDFIYGRITTVDDDSYEGRLRWGGEQEAFWGDYFNGAKKENTWAVFRPLTPEERRGIEIFGIKFGGQSRSNNLRRLFMARFGDIARIEAHFADVQVTLKSGTVVVLDRFAAGDVDDGVRVWQGSRAAVDLDARQIRTIEFLATAPLVGAPDRLHGTVRTRAGDFTGFIQWDEEDGASTDELKGRTRDGELSLRYETIRSITRRSRDSALVTLIDGREMVLSGSRDVSDANRGIYVNDRRYGRVQISWDAFEHIDFSRGGTGPAYHDFAPGRPLTGRVTTRDGRGLAGRLVYDFDESESTETFDAPSQGVDYNIPFGLISSIVPGGPEPGGARARLILRGGEELPLDRAGDFGDRNAGLLIFVEGRERPEYLPWPEVERVDFDRHLPAAGT